MGRLKKLALSFFTLVAVGTMLALLLRASAPQVPSDAWAQAGDMATNRAGSAAALLADGRVLVTGGTNGTAVTSTTERYSPTAGSFLSTPSMQDARANHSATLLADGRVLVAGGVGTDGHALASAEIYDGVSNSWTPVAPLYRARAGHTATLLADGRVLVAGGDDSGAAIDSLEVFDPVAGVFSQLASTLSSPRTGHAAALLGDGRVLVIGGFNGTNALASTDVFDAAAGDAVSAGPSLGTARAGASATTLLDGTVFVTGGASDTELKTTEIFNPATNNFAPGAALAVARQRHQALLLPHNNNILIVGGTQGGNAVATAELYQPWNYTMLPAGAPNMARAWAAGSALSYPADKTIRTGPNDGLLLLVGGSAKADASSPVKSAELYGFATIRTDKEDYAPGTTVTITGSGWQPGETVALTLVEQPLLDTHPLLPVTADGNGNITSSEFVPDQHDIGITFYLNAYGSTSQAQTTFRDSKPNSVAVSPGSVTVGPGGSAAYTVTVGFNGNGNPCTTLPLTTSALPAGAAASFSPTTVSDTSPTSTLTITTTGAIAIGSSTFTVTATAGGGTCQSGSATSNPNTTLVVAAKKVGTIAVGAQTGTLAYGTAGSAAYTVTVNRNGAAGTAFSADLSLTTILPTGVTASFSPSTVNFLAADTSKTSTLTLTTTAATPAAASTGFTVLASNPAVPGDSSTGNGALAVGKRPVTVTFTAADKTYDGNNTATVSACVIATGKVGSDDVTCTVAGGTFASANASASAQTVSATATLGGAVVSNYTVTNPVTTTAKINKAIATVVVAPYTVTYNGLPHAATVTSITGVNGETGATVGTVDLSNTSHTNAGTYASDTWSFTGAANYQDIAPTTITDTINKATATVVVTPYTVPYDGQAHTAAITSITGVNGETGATVGTVNVANTTHTNAGTYATDTWSFTGAANYQNIAATTITDTINKAIATVVVTPYTVTYDGQPHTAAITSITGVNGETGATVGTVDVSNTTHTNAGTYATDTWSFTGAANYQNIAATTITDTINKAMATVVVTPYTVPYDGQSHTAAITSITGVNSETGATVGTVDVSNTTHTNAGTYASDTWSFTGAANYQNIAATTITDTINKATATVVVTPYTVPYDGQSHTAAITSITGANGETGATVGTVNVSNTTHTNAGTYSTDAWSFTGAANYQDIAATTITDTINKATATVVVAPYTVTYDGQPHTAGITSITGVNGETGATVGTVDVSNTTHTNAGIYAGDFWTFAGTVNYQSIGATTITDTINQAATSTSVASDHNPAATGQLITYTATVTSGSGVPTGTVTFYDNVTVLGTGALDVTGHATWATSNLTVGTHPISAAYGGSLNFSGSPSSALNEVVDTPPTAAADAFSLFQDTSLAAGAPGVLANDNDAEGTAQTVTAVLVTGPSSAGAFALNANGSFSYTPNPGFTGSDSFTYKPFDGVLNGNTVTVSLTVLATGASPVAQADAYHTAKDTLLAAAAVDGVLNNDRSALPLTAVLVAGPAHASAFALNSDGSFSYTPNTGFAGSDSFTYKSNDGSTDSNVQQVLIAVVAPAATLVANNDNSTVDQDGTLVKTAVQGVLANDAGASGAELVLAPLYGTVALAADGSFTYTPAAGFNGVDSFLYRAVSDPDASNVAMVSIRVRATTAFSDLSAPTIVYGTATTTLSGKVTAGSMVPPNTEHVSITLNGVTHDATIQSDGTFSSDFDTHALDVAHSTYTIKWQYDGDTTFTPASTTTSLTVNKATATVVVTPYTATYDGQPHTAAVTSITGVNGETGATVGTVDVSNTTHTNASVYASDSWSFTGAANYHDIAATTITDTIDKATATVVVTPYTVTYNGQPHTATITSITGVNGETGATVGTVDVSNTTHTNASVYASDSWSFTGAANYHDIAATTITDTIDKATATVVVTPYTVTYNGQPHTATITSITGVNGETGATVGTVDVANTTHTNADTYASDSWSFIGTANYQNIAATTITDVIQQATATVVVAPYTVTYNGQPHTATITSITGVNGETGATVGTVNVSNTTHTNTGTYGTDTWSFTGTANYQNIAATTITDVIQQATATVVVAPYTVTYNGQPHTATITSITGVNGETGATVGTVDVSNTTHTNTGTYGTDSWSFTGTANYQNIAATTITDVIQQATATVVVAPYTVTYNGQPHTATITSITGANGETGATVGTVDVSNTTHTNTGTYGTDSWSFTGTANYQNIAATTITDVIQQATATVVVTPYTVTYNGQPHTAAVTSITGVNGETGATVGTVDVANTTHTNTGTYGTDSWSFTGTANYQNIAATTITDVIQQATATVVVTPYTVTYNGQPHTAAVTSITGVNGETGATVGTVDVSNTTHTNTGTYGTDSWSFTGTANYQNIAATTITDVIQQATATVVVTPYTATYNGQPHTAAVTSITGVNGETGATVGTVNVANTTHTNAGTYASDTWSFTGAANYHDIAATTITDVINQAGSTTNVAVADVTYDGSPHGGSALVAGVGGLSQILTVHYTGRNGTVYADSVTAPTGAGDYTASATFTGDTNHAGSADSKSFTINRAPSSTVVSCPASVDYSGSPLTPCAAAVSGVGGLALVGAPIDYTNNVAKGQATAAYSYAGDVNHTGASGLAHFQIVDAHPIAQAKQVEVIVRPFHDDGDDDDRHDHDEFDRRGHDGHGWDGHVGDDDDTDGEWEHDADNAKAVRITLSATDADSLRLAFSVLTAPTHGRLSRVRKVSCTPDGHGGTLCTARVIYFPQPHNAAGDSFTYQVSDGVLSSAPATVTINIVPPFTTFTQGEWGSTPNGQNPGWFLATNFASVYSGGTVTIGAGTRTLRFGSAAAIKSFLPAGGKAGVLLAGALNPTSSKGGVFAGQVLALQLNVDFSAAMKTRSGLGALVLTKGALKGQTVAQVLTLANSALGGGALPAGMSISDLSDIVSKINDNYDRGKEDDGDLR